MTNNAIKLGQPSNEAAPGQTLTLEVYERLRVDIRSGNLNPGVPLRMEWLKTSYDVGATPLREALSRLAAEYLVTTEGKRGFRVAPVSLKELEELVSLRDNIERQALEIAVRLGDDDWEAELVAARHRLSNAPPGGETVDTQSMEEREKRHRAFHLALISACDSVWLLRIWRQMSAHLERYRRLGLRGHSTSPEGAQRIEVEHRAIMEAVLARDAVAASALLHEHRRVMEAKVMEWASQSALRSG
ncbi:MAG: FCD domain-containing protein [Alphaproteobacteria bacterium]